MADLETDIHTFNSKGKTGLYKLVVFLEIGVTCLLLFFGYTFVFKLQTPQPSQISKAAQTLSTTPLSQTPIPTKFEIAHTYRVIRIGESDVTFQGDEGELAVPKAGPGVVVFKGTPESHSDARVTDLSIGQRVILEIIPGERVWIYIL